MKRFLSLLTVLTLVITSCTKFSHGSDDFLPRLGREDNPNGGGGNTTKVIPAAVLSAFTARYPDAIQVQWKLASDGNYKVEFYRGSIKWQAIFTAAGKLVKEEHK